MPNKQNKDGEEELETVDIENVEILAAGTWHGNKTVTIPEDAIPSFVGSFNELTANKKLNYEPPAKLGHDDGQKLLQADGYPAAGWVSSLKAKGEKLMASFKGVPKKLAEIIKAGGYKKVSAEFYQDYETDGKKYPWVLKAVAFLGADIPAVKSIKDITAQYSEALLDEQGVPYSTAVYELEAPAAANNDKQKNEQEVIMEKEIKELLQLDEKADVLEAVSALKAKAEKPEQVSLAEHQETVNKVTALETKLAERDRDERVGKAIQSGKITPAQAKLPAILNMAEKDPEGFKAFVESQPVVVKLGEVGTSGGEEAVDLTEAEIKMSEKLGVTKEDLIKAKKQS